MLSDVFYGDLVSLNSRDAMLGVGDFSWTLPSLTRRFPVLAARCRPILDFPRLTGSIHTETLELLPRVRRLHVAGDI